MAITDSFIGRVISPHQRQSPQLSLELVFRSFNFVDQKNAKDLIDKVSKFSIRPKERFLFFTTFEQFGEFQLQWRIKTLTTIGYKNVQIRVYCDIQLTSCYILDILDLTKQVNLLKFNINKAAESKQKVCHAVIFPL